MNTSRQIVLHQLEHVWKEHVRADYFNGDLTYGEQAVHASVAHHLRNHLTELSDFRVWHEVSISSIHPSLRANPQKDKRTVDLILAFAETKSLTKRELVPLDLSEVTHIDLFAAIEIKYASYAISEHDLSYYDYIARIVGDIPEIDRNLALLVYDLAKLVDIRNMYLPDIHPIFAYIPGTAQTVEMEGWKRILSKIAKENSVSFLFGDPVDSDKWAVQK